MRLPRPFCQLPLLFDVARLQAEVAALPDEAWVPHPDGLAGNAAVRLITVGGAENDAHNGPMHPTRWLDAMPYARQALAAFGVVWSRARLMRLAPGATVPDHADINLHWHTRVRVHIPVFTTPDVRFHCGSETAHMAAGEAWIFDTWRRHRVENPAPSARVHLVADTTGTARFWQSALGVQPPRGAWPTIGWRPGTTPPLPTERNARTAVMPAAEVQWLVDDWCADLALAGDGPDTPGRIAALRALASGFIHDWRQLCAFHGLSGEGEARFLACAQQLHAALVPLADGVVMRSNAANARHVLEKRVLQHLVLPQG